MVSKTERYGWVIVFATLLAFAIPWFMWGDGRVTAGLPLWLWWHIGWMALASVVFWLFAKRAWGLGIVNPSVERREPREPTDRGSERGERA